MKKILSSLALTLACASIQASENVTFSVTLEDDDQPCGVEFGGNNARIHLTDQYGSSFYGRVVTGISGGQVDFTIAKATNYQGNIDPAVAYYESYAHGSFIREPIDQNFKVLGLENEEEFRLSVYAGMSRAELGSGTHSIETTVEFTCNTTP
ncbi:hypothetical protein [Vibrio ishigakensis]|uniref:hypothetical protein n=1 Tax=Vibrio ishigakensis TaxID=1481914 RepID=UPI0021C35EE5|nr:hypothetical protein [Vibrio ishigakensis]